MACRGLPVDYGPGTDQTGRTGALLNHTHQPVDTPYRARHAIYVRDGADAVQGGELVEL